jgi:hypothetical protein
LVWAYTAVAGTKSFGSVLGVPLGTIETRMILQAATPSHGVSGIFANVFLASCPQVIISLIYFSYNAVISSMLLAHKFSGYTKERKGLRVSSDQSGAQRTSYFLQLPYRHALPLMAFSVLVHWLASQGIFVVAVEAYNLFGNHDESGACFNWPERRGYSSRTFNGLQPTALRYCGSDFITCVYSPLATLLTTTMACLLILFLVFLCFKRLGTMLVAGSNSIAIAAACHSRSGEERAGENSVMWGAFRECVRLQPAVMYE